MAGRHLLEGSRTCDSRRRPGTWTGEGGRLRLLGGAVLFASAARSSASATGTSRAATPSRAACWRCGRAVGSRCGNGRAPGARAQRHRRGLSAEARAARRVSALGRHPLREGPEAVPCRREPAVLRAARARATAVRVAVFGATGVVGQALLPLLADAHEVVAVSRNERESSDGTRWVTADAAAGTASPPPWKEPRSSTTSSTRSALATSSSRTGRRRPTSPDAPLERA